MRCLATQQEAGYCVA